MPYQNLTSTLDAAALTPINTALTTVQTALAPHSINLTPDEIKKMYKMGTNRQALGIRAIQLAGDNATLVPSYFSLAAIRQDMDRYTNLVGLEARLEQLLAGVRDGRMASGSEVMFFVKGFYQSLQTAAGQNVPGAKALVDQLAPFYDLPDQPDGDTPDTP